jgi:hypothetical protein
LDVICGKTSAEAKPGAVSRNHSANGEPKNEQDERIRRRLEPNRKLAGALEVDCRA